MHYLNLSISIGLLSLLLTACEKKPTEPEHSEKNKDTDVEKTVEAPPEPATAPDSSITYDEDDDMDYVGSSSQQKPEPIPEPEPEPEPPTPQELLAQAAIERTMYTVIYDGRYVKIDYPMGDVPAYMGVCTDVVIRSLRRLNIDLQKQVHEDISANFSKYPNQKRWGLKRPDKNIDHRRVPNLRVFFERHGEILPITDRGADYKPGDIVTWNLDAVKTHIGIVSEQRVDDIDEERYLIVHNIGEGPVLEDMLFAFDITGHYRYPLQTAVVKP
ncbi:MAG: DUF1287 domain-containing protein [uncultured Thiotrichaceae bacterium]|uniref:DUF1287 domain-containing protein n=1 Tax=uncultured Thiotrichaceae bacterium TaxID=298394 RepID=A0A6S6U018_9GAMM|nr:MAG: DUF1287 domain-containing protein [uncultured Thiotrichaceae bacterium]